ncbi:hypothetical protein H0H92_006121 [Tricholoma furcatifolium]|nr:hypothetical protein H0H92_006121 [Tricholoma furcatifolium]
MATWVVISAGWGNFSSFALLKPICFLLPAVVGIVTSSVHIFFCWRTWVLRKYSLLAGFVTALSLTSCGVAITCGVFLGIGNYEWLRPFMIVLPLASRNSISKNSLLWDNRIPTLKEGDKTLEEEETFEIYKIEASKNLSGPIQDLSTSPHQTDAPSSVRTQRHSDSKGQPCGVGVLPTSLLEAKIMAQVLVLGISLYMDSQSPPRSARFPPSARSSHFPPLPDVPGQITPRTSRIPPVFFAR